MAGGQKEWNMETTTGSLQKASCWIASEAGWWGQKDRSSDIWEQETCWKNGSHYPGERCKLYFPSALTILI